MTDECRTVRLTGHPVYAVLHGCSCRCPKKVLLIVGENGVDDCLARPKSETGRGVWVLPAWWGLTRSFKEFCERLAHTGFVVLASSGIKQLQKNFEARGRAVAFYTDAHTSQ